MAFKMKGFSPFTKNGDNKKVIPTNPTHPEGGDKCIADFLKNHNVTSDQVNTEIYRIAEQSGVPGEDDVDLADWKGVVKSLSKKKLTK